MDASRLHLVVATPCFGGMVTQRYMQSAIGLLQLATASGLTISLELLGGDSLITRSRNALVAKFLDKPGTTHLLFVDADIGFEPKQVGRMLIFDADIVAGMYPLKLHDWSPAALTRAREGEAVESAPLRYVGVPCDGDALRQRDGFITGLFAGTGFMLIKRQALEAMARAYPHTRYTATHADPAPTGSPNQHALFDCMIEPETGHYLSEDYTFCRRWRDIGGEIWLDTQGSLLHIGPYEFAGHPDVRFPAVARS